MNAGLLRFSAAMALALLFSGGAMAQTRGKTEAAPPAVTTKEKTSQGKIAVIDVQRILQESLAARSVQKQLEAHRAKFQSEISGREKDLHDADTALKELREKGATGADAAQLDQRERNLREKFMAIERDVQGKRHALDEAFTASMGVVRNNLLQAVQELAAERGVQAVLLKQQLLWHDSAMDVTDAVLARLNERVKDVTVKIVPPEVPEDAAKPPVPEPSPPKN